MKFKSLVITLVIVLTIISLFQLSFTWFVKKHEHKMYKNTFEWVRKAFPTPEQKYSNDPVQQSLYKDSLEIIFNNRYKKLLDSTKDKTITYGLQGPISYQKAKENELNLGLDLQGGMSVTLEVNLEDMIRGMVLNPKDTILNQALSNATKLRGNSNLNYIELFVEEYKKLNPNIPIIAIFNLTKVKQLQGKASEADIIQSLQQDADLAVENTFNILLNRIDQFGVAQPYINLDKNKGLITVELAGVSNPERVRKYLQSSANLEFFEVYTDNQIKDALIVAEKTIENLANQQKVLDTKSQEENTSRINTSKMNPTEKLLAGSSKNSSNGQVSNSQNPLTQLLNKARENGAEIGIVALQDTATLGEYLRNPTIKALFPSDLVFMYSMPIRVKDKTTNNLYLYAIKVPTSGAPLDGKHIIDANQDFDQTRGGMVIVNMEMDTEGATIWGNLTQRNVGRPIAVVMDNTVYTAPSVNEPILTGRSQISGNYTVQEGSDFAKLLKAGRLPAPAVIVQEQLVGPTLGQRAIDGGLLSFAIAFGVIFLLMLLYYNVSGWIADVALILNLFFTVGVLSALGATLTAPGIAGLVLTIGMAVDTNVLIFERIKEELSLGKGLNIAIKQGYKKSLAPILDSHITSFLTALILFNFGLGPIKGFATTQMLGIVLSLFCGILVSRLLNDWWMKKYKNIKYFTPISKKIFTHNNIPFVTWRKYAYVLSSLLLIVGISSFWNGFDEGVEFAGGRSYQVRFEQPVNIEQVRESLKQSFGENPIIKTVGNNYQLDITTSYLIKENPTIAEKQVEQKLYEGLQPYLAKGITLSDFNNQHILGSKTILPTISDNLKKGATWATILSLIIIALYILIRFRNWLYSLGTILSLFHDVLVILAVFSYCRKWVPFPLEIDQHFIAAILTVIGFSMNDTVIVFDRIREYSKKLVGKSKSEIINEAINHTLSRTIMTSLTIFLTILILFLLGGEATKGFAFAMLIGVITGTYSSIFVAAPVLLDFNFKKKV
ncbi:MAG: protein translocase subunit SecDF [Chitinophagaceae bacterium]